MANNLSTVLDMYGLKACQRFDLKNETTGGAYWFNTCGDLMYFDERSTMTLGYFLLTVTKNDIVLYLPNKEQPKDYLNQALSLIGLETMQPFGINDGEYPDHYYIDSFGDLYVINKNNMDDEIHDYLTLGRVLTQYYDKITTYKDDLVDN